MKKLLTMLLVLVLVLGMFAGCTTTDEPEETTASEATEAPAETEEVSADSVEIGADVLFKSVDARKAIAIGYDKEFIIVEILGDNGSLASDSFVPVGFTYYEGVDFRDAIAEAPTYDPAEAAELWAAAKEELGFETAVIELLNYDSDSAGKIGEHIKEELERNLEGLTVEIKALPFAEKLELSQAGDFDLNFAGWGPDYPNALTFLDMWVTDGEYNEGHWSNAEYDALIETAQTSTDPDEVWAAMVAAEELVTTEYPIAPLYQRGGVSLIAEDITDMYKHGFGPDYTYKWTDKAAGDDGRKVLSLLENTDIPDLDQNATTDTLSFEMLNNVCEGLMRLSDGDLPVLGGAESFEYADGAYTFKLREDAVWVKADGTVYGNVTAHDYVYSWNRLQSEELAAQYSFLATLPLLGIESYEAVDDYTFKVVAKESELFKALMAFPAFFPVNEAFVTEVTSELYGKTVDTMLFNGPFYLNEWELTSHTTCLKNDEYWDADVVNLDEIYTRYITGVENNTAVQMYLDGEIDRVGLSGENVAKYKDRDDASPFGETVCFYLMFNIADY